MGEQHDKRENLNKEKVNKEDIVGYRKLDDDNLNVAGGEKEDVEAKRSKFEEILAKAYTEPLTMRVVTDYGIRRPTRNPIKAAVKNLEEENKRLKEEIKKLEQELEKQKQPGIRPMGP